MFSNCIHCTANLDRNEAFESFPVGTRLAFDAGRGRLWVVCRHCGRWNLSALEERWEAIEEMERRFRDTRLRVSTDNVGLARLREGVDLIRIGEPQRPEMAAWRYGDQFGRRRRRQLLIAGTTVGGVAAIMGGVMVMGASVSAFAGVYANGGFWDSLIHGRQSASIGKVFLPEGRLVDVQRRHARMSAFESTGPDDLLRLRLEHVDGTSVVTGEDAMRIAARLLPTVNRFGGSAKSVQGAVQILEESGSPMRVLLNSQHQHGWREGDPIWGVWRRGAGAGLRGGRRRNIQKLPGALHTLDVEERLAIEMALHEESERRAMEGELKELETAWREAEEIAHIADNLLTPADVELRLGQLRMAESCRRGVITGTVTGTGTATGTGAGTDN